MRLAVGDRRTVGAADAVADELAAEPVRSGELVILLFDLDRGVRMRAADALEKASALAPELLRDHEQRLIVCAEDAADPELKWHLARMLPRLALEPHDRAAALDIVHGWLADDSVVVRVEALDAFAALAAGDPALAAEVQRRLDEALASGRPAEKARARQILRTRTAPAPAGHGQGGHGQGGRDRTGRTRAGRVPAEPAAAR
ncbi:hypothetical protein PQJ75_26445 [Rhodoplanes sp. TEM]|uniref:HEAT repeat domain-containing protein n=1 Tax=Rhodoplanes tepidamans TaxID=200616 RepID=A0ABT5JDU3_RHOTP|nr:MULTISPECIES: hypothetical protein [Rhodoplanes]MDC7787802.1 hypothetical protein [Rhodoplanes tepidamans]MDC7987289.1 hypothetical protein [Rhodoplanes sp. TEM]MDQ0357718.1 hypothetical protein [Rhodoplanes tepidamans]